MTGIMLAAGVLGGVPWRHLALLAFVLMMPLPALILVAIHSWWGKPDRSMRAPWFCDAVSTELRAGASVRAALEAAARSVEALETATACRRGAPMDSIARVASTEFPEIAEELGVLLARSDGLGVAPAGLFDEIGNLALARVQVSHEVAAASAPGKAAGVVLLALPILALAITVSRDGLEEYLAQPAQRAAALLGIALTVSGLSTAIMILRRSR